MSSRIGYRKYGLVLAALAVGTYAHGQDQTYKVNGGSSQEPPKPPARQARTQSSEKNLGWGSNIQNARLVHAAESALRQRNFAAAVEYAQRAAQAAPNDAQLWFLLGYSARLSGRLQLAVDAYSRGLQANPALLEGLSGLAQTYSVMGRKDDAQALLNQVLTADPRRADDLRLLGEILLQTGQYERALGPLERAERLPADPARAGPRGAGGFRRCRPEPDRRQARRHDRADAGVVPDE